ncbi:MAG TPA: hypothetical protein VGM59_08660 [Dongiaceae bacterium]|jgi:hypothetical protein
MILDIDIFLCLGVLMLAALVPVSVVWETAIGAVCRDVKMSLLGFAAAEATLVVLVYWVLFLLELFLPFSNLGKEMLIVFVLKLSVQAVSMLCGGEGSLRPAASGWLRFLLNAGAPSIALLFWCPIERSAFG